MPVAVPNLSDFDTRKYKQQERLLQDLEAIQEQIRRTTPEVEELQSLSRQYLIEAIKDRKISPYKAVMASSRLMSNEIQHREVSLKIYDRLSGMIGPTGPLEEDEDEITKETPREIQREAERLVVKMVEWRAKQTKEARKNGEGLTARIDENGDTEANGKAVAGG